jgi:hypothetical protein
MKKPNHPKPPWYLDLQPLRVPAGWAVGWNTLYVSSKAENGDFGGSSIFSAVNQGRRFWIDVEFRPEFDPEGYFELTVHYQPWPRTERGKRRTDVPFQFDGDAEVVHTFKTQAYAELVDELETWLARCTTWEREGH